MPPVAAAVPRSAGATRANPIDAFVEQKLAAAGLEPAPEAEPELLLRRLLLDLTGLPPTLDELDQFATDFARDPEAAWSRWLQRIFEEEPYVSGYAERMASPWMDAARYADTSGIHTDAGRQIWPWRDWVLEAYRSNKPFDEFLTEQLAGDLFPDATQANLIASGFNRNHVTTDEGGSIDEEYLVEYAVDRVNTTGSVFLGLTMGCARCHDHKFDPVTQSEPILAAIFEHGVRVSDQYSDAGRMAEALGYLKNQRDELSRFLEDGRLPMDNNACERSIRPIAIGRRNWIFAGGVRVGEAASTW